MKNKKNHTLSSLQDMHGDRIHQIIQAAIEEESSIVNMVANPAKEEVSPAQKAADWITWFSGSMLFLILNGLLFLVWISINTLPFGVPFFDPYPFGLLTMIVSLEAIFLSCFVLISQNRQEEKDRQRSEDDYLINLKAEIELRSLHQKIDLLLEEQIEALYDTQAEQLKLLGAIKKKLKKHSKSTF